MLVPGKQSGRTTSFCWLSGCTGLEETENYWQSCTGGRRYSKLLRGVVPARGALHGADNRLAGIEVNRAGRCTRVGVVPEDKLALPLLLHVSL